MYVSTCIYNVLDCIMDLSICIGMYLYLVYDLANKILIYNAYQYVLVSICMYLYFINMYLFV